MFKIFTVVSLQQNHPPNNVSIRFVHFMMFKIFTVPFCTQTSVLELSLSPTTAVFRYDDMQYTSSWA
jgi:hypothetical protein